MNKDELYTSAYGAKFAREKKENPCDWLIKPCRIGYELVFVGFHRSEKNGAIYEKKTIQMV